MPIVWHVIQLYAVQGFRRFLLATGYKGELIERFVAAQRWPRGRVRRVRGHRPGNPDGRADQAAGGALGGEERSARPTPTGSPTSTWTRCWSFTRPRRAGEHDRRPPELQFGVTELDRRRPRDGLSREAPLRALDQRWLLLLAAGSSTTWSPTACSSAPRLDGWPPQASCARYRHEGFWECMDTYKDAVALNDLWASGRLRGGCGAGDRPRQDAAAPHRLRRIENLFGPRLTPRSSTDPARYGARVDSDASVERLQPGIRSKYDQTLRRSRSRFLAANKSSTARDAVDPMSRHQRVLARGTSAAGDLAHPAVNAQQVLATDEQGARSSGVRGRPDRRGRGAQRGGVRLRRTG